MIYGQPLSLSTTVKPAHRSCWSDRILTALGVGKQSPQYKRVKALLDQLMT